MGVGYALPWRMQPRGCFPRHVIFRAIRERKKLPEGERLASFKEGRGKTRAPPTEKRTREDYVSLNGGVENAGTYRVLING